MLQNNEEIVSGIKEYEWKEIANSKIDDTSVFIRTVEVKHLWLLCNYFVKKRVLIQHHLLELPHLTQTLTYLLYSASGAFHSILLLSNLFLPSLPLSHLHLGQLFKQCLRLYQMLLIKGFTFSGGCTQTFYVISLNASLPTTSGWQQVIKRKKEEVIRTATVTTTKNIVITWIIY